MLYYWNIFIKIIKIFRIFIFIKITNFSHIIITISIVFIVFQKISPLIGSGRALVYST